MRIIKSRANQRKSNGRLEYIKALSLFEAERQWQERYRAAEELENLTQEMFVLVRNFKAFDLLPPMRAGIDLFTNTAQKAVDLRDKVFPLSLRNDLHFSMVRLVSLFKAQYPQINFTLFIDDEIVSENFEFSWDLKLSIYKIVMEAVKNAVKHAQPANIWIQITHAPIEPLNDDAFEPLVSDPNLVMVSVEDDGKGFIPPANFRDYQTLVRKGHFGLAIIQQEVSKIGGALTINAMPNDSTVLIAELTITRTPTLAEQLANIRKGK